MNEIYKKEMTTLDTPIAVGEGQSYTKRSSESIPDWNSEVKSFGESLDDWDREMLRISNPGYLKTVSMTELYETVYMSKPPLIDGLLNTGTYLFVGAPKLGKSFLMEQLAYHISTGTPLWGYQVRKGTVLYLALEDDYRRLQKRLYRMVGSDGSDNLFFSVDANKLGDGLDEQLARFMREHPDTNLIIIDTLQKVREVGGDSYSYANDICLLLVHHTRKQNADDKFDMISGTNGLLGAADGAFLLAKESAQAAPLSLKCQAETSRT